MRGKEQRKRSGPWGWVFLYLGSRLLGEKAPRLCFQLLQNFLPWWRSGLSWVVVAPGLRRETEFTRCWCPEDKWGWGNRVCEPLRLE